MRVIVHFSFMSRMLMVVRPMLPPVLVVMHMGIAFMGVGSARASVHEYVHGCAYENDHARASGPRASAHGCGSACAHGNAGVCVHVSLPYLALLSSPLMLS